MRYVIALFAALFCAALANAGKTVALAPGDCIAINVYDLLAPNTDFADVQQIRAEGTVRIPLVGPVKVAGLTTRQARDLVEQTLVDSKVIADPQVRVGLRLSADQLAEKPAPAKAGDRLLVRICELVKPGEDYTALLEVKASGEVELPEVGKVQVVGMSIDEIEKAIIQRLKGTFVKPQLHVRVDPGFVSALPPFGGRATQRP